MFSTLENKKSLELKITKLLERYTCHRCTMSFRIGRPKIKGSKHEAHTCPDCKLFFHCTGEIQNGKSVAVPYITTRDEKLNDFKIKEEI